MDEVLESLHYQKQWYLFVTKYWKYSSRNLSIECVIINHRSTKHRQDNVSDNKNWFDEIADCEFEKQIRSYQDLKSKGNKHQEIHTNPLLIRYTNRFKTIYSLNWHIVIKAIQRVSYKVIFHRCGPTNSCPTNIW